jgi:hypothetical protein
VPTYKRIDGDYQITTINSQDRVIIDTNTLEVQGNLDVTGNLTYINVEELNIRDPFILLNASNTGSYASNSGILTHKTSTDYAGLRWSNTAAQWQISNSTSQTGETGTWVNLLSEAEGAAGINTQVQFNNNGAFGASANYTFDLTQDRVTLQGHQVFGNIVVSPGATANAVAVYHNEAGAGGTGLWFQDPGFSDELVSRRRAILFGIIF